jgi:hypothetical protein
VIDAGHAGAVARKDLRPAGLGIGFLVDVDVHQGAARGQIRQVGQLAALQHLMHMPALGAVPADQHGVARRQAQCLALSGSLRRGKQRRQQQPRQQQPFHRKVPSLSHFPILCQYWIACS